jgi:hypothetical protein
MADFYESYMQCASLYNILTCPLPDHFRNGKRPNKTGYDYLDDDEFVYIDKTYDFSEAAEPPLAFKAYIWYNLSDSDEFDDRQFIPILLIFNEATLPAYVRLHPEIFPYIPYEYKSKEVCVAAIQLGCYERNKDIYPLIKEQLLRVEG